MSNRQSTPITKLIEALAVIADNRGMQVTVRQSGKGALVAGGLALIGESILASKIYNLELDSNIIH